MSEVTDRSFMSNNFFLKIMPFSWDNMEKHDRAIQVTDDNIV